MSLLDKRKAYKPFEYPQAFDYFMKQQQAHWLFTEVPMTSDIQDFKFKLSAEEKNVVTQVLRLFTTTETIVGEYWSSNVAKWFPKPEIQQMALTFAGFETIHISAYAHLNETLGLPDSEFESFLIEPSMKAKMDALSAAIDTVETKEQIAKSLAVFSAFTEGVALFSSFAVLMNFGRFNKLKGLGQIVSWSVRDEDTHASAGCWLFREFIKENPEIWTDDFKKQIYQAARDCVELEDAYIDKIFEMGDIEGLSKQQLKAYIRYRANTKLGDLGLKSNWKNLEKEMVSSLTTWFDVMVSGVEHADFFSTRSTSYSKGHVNWDNLFEDSK